MGNDTFSLFLSDQMATVSVQNPAVLNNINLAELHSLHTAKITNYD
jgi:hypothetical protein